MIEKKDRGLVHHMLVYACKDDFDEAHLNVTGLCYEPNMPPSIRGCVGISPILGWAVGGNVILLYSYVQNAKENLPSLEAFTT